MSRRSLRAWLNKADDPLVAGVLWCLALATVVAVVLPWRLTSYSAKEIGDVVLKVAGGILLLLSSYFAARTLKQTRADQRTGRILEATQLLADVSVSVRFGAISVLLNLAESSKGLREGEQVAIIRGVLAARSHEAATHDAELSMVIDRAVRRIDDWNKRHPRWHPDIR